MVGVIAHEKVNAFERVLWRACRRTAFLRHCEIKEVLENPDSVHFISLFHNIIILGGKS